MGRGPFGPKMVFDIDCSNMGARGKIETKKKVSETHRVRCGGGEG